MIKIYGSTDTYSSTHTDTSKTLLGAKQYATRNGLNNVSVRKGHSTTLLEYKSEGKWYTYKELERYLFE